MSTKVVPQAAHAADSKEAKLQRVAEATLKIIFETGKTQVSISKLSVEAKVSRPWIYKYLGGSHKALIEHAIDYYGALYARLDHDMRVSDPKEWVELIVQRTRRMWAEAGHWKWLVPIYFRFRGSKTLLGQAIDKIEGRYQVKLAQSMRSSFGISNEMANLYAEMLTLFRMGLAHRFSLDDRPSPELVESYVASFRPMLEALEAHFKRI
jgi:hypothetical protein